MSKLLSANFARLIKNRDFWGCMIAMASFGVFMLYMVYMPIQRTGDIVPLENLLFGYANVIGIAAAAFVSMFLGTEYSDGTMRNKLIAGHGRCTLYLSELIVNVAAVLMLNFVYVAIIGTAGVPLLGNVWELEAGQIWMLLGVSACADIAFTAVFTLLGMLNQNKTSVAVISLVGVMAFIMTTGYLSSRLKEPEIFEAYTEVTDKGYIISREAEPNLDYVTGTKRQVYEFLCDFLPTGQCQQIHGREVENPGRLILYSAVIAAASTGAGIFAFRKKDIN